MMTKRLFLVLFLALFVVACAERNIILPDAAGKAYGSVWFHDDNGRVLELGASNTYTVINFSDGCAGLNVDCNVWNFTVQRAGVYDIDYHSSFSDGANQEFHLSVGINGVAEDEQCHSSRKIGTGGDVGSMGSTCQLNLSVDDFVSIMIENENTTTNALIKDYSLAAVKI